MRYSCGGGGGGGDYRLLVRYNTYSTAASLLAKLLDVFDAARDSDPPDGSPTFFCFAKGLIGSLTFSKTGTYS